MRASLARRGGALVALGPLPETDVTTLVTAMLGTPPEDTLRQLTAQAAGNPLYLRELVDSLTRERAVGGLSTTQEQLPVSLAAVLNDRLSSVSAQTAPILRTAALLGRQVHGHGPGRAAAQAGVRTGGGSAGGRGGPHPGRLGCRTGVPASS